MHNIKNIGDSMIQNQLKSVGVDIKKLKGKKSPSADDKKKLDMLETYEDELKLELKNRISARAKRVEEKAKPKGFLSKIVDTLSGNKEEAE